MTRAISARLKSLVERYRAGLFSEHLAWSTHEGVYLNDLLPLPYTEETLDGVSEHVDEVQEMLRPADVDRESLDLRRFASAT